MDHEVVKPKPTPVEDGYYLYHLTHIDNLPDILKYSLLSRNELLRCSAPFKEKTGSRWRSAQGFWPSA